MFTLPCLMLRSVSFLFVCYYNLNVMPSDSSVNSMWPWRTTHTGKYRCYTCLFVSVRSMIKWKRAEDEKGNFNDGLRFFEDTSLLVFFHLCLFIKAKDKSRRHFPPGRFPEPSTSPMVTLWYCNSFSFFSFQHFKTTSLKKGDRNRKSHNNDPNITLNDVFTTQRHICWNSFWSQQNLQLQSELWKIKPQQERVDKKHIVIDIEEWIQ